jgi:hypothetical protein
MFGRKRHEEPSTKSIDCSSDIGMGIVSMTARNVISLLRFPFGFGLYLLIDYWIRYRDMSALQIWFAPLFGIGCLLFVRRGPPIRKRKRSGLFDVSGTEVTFTLLLLMLITVFATVMSNTYRHNSIPDPARVTEIWAVVSVWVVALDLLYERMRNQA